MADAELGLVEAVKTLGDLLASATSIHLEARREERNGEERYVVIGRPCCIPVATFGDCSDAMLLVGVHQYLPTILAALKPSPPPSSPLKMGG